MQVSWLWLPRCKAHTNRLSLGIGLGHRLYKHSNTKCPAADDTYKLQHIQQIKTRDCQSPAPGSSTQDTPPTAPWQASACSQQAAAAAAGSVSAVPLLAGCSDGSRRGIRPEGTSPPSWPSLTEGLRASRHTAASLSYRPPLRQYCQQACRSPSRPEAAPAASCTCLKALGCVEPAGHPPSLKSTAPYRR